MSEDMADYGVSYIASAPEEFKIKDKVAIIDEEDDFYKEVGEVLDVLVNGDIVVRVKGKALVYDPIAIAKVISKTSDTIRFDEGDNPEEPWNVGMFRSIAKQMVDTYARKNATYGDSFTKSVKKYGFISALTRMSDKFNRIENLILGAKNKVPDESLEDTLIDLACYSVMSVIAMRDAKIGDVDFENVK